MDAFGEEQSEADQRLAVVYLTRTNCKVVSLSYEVVHDDDQQLRFWLIAS
jgi:hypothetical protein